MDVRDAPLELIVQDLVGSSNTPISIWWDGHSFRAFCHRIDGSGSTLHEALVDMFTSYLATLDYRPEAPQYGFYQGLDWTPIMKELRNVSSDS